jgi:hypothetical protein
MRWACGVGNRRSIAGREPARRLASHFSVRVSCHGFKRIVVEQGRGSHRDGLPPRLSISSNDRSPIRRIDTNAPGPLNLAVRDSPVPKNRGEGISGQIVPKAIRRRSAPAVDKSAAAQHETCAGAN